MSERICVCGVEHDMFQADQAWPKTHLKYAVTAQLPGLSQASLRECVRQAFASWAAVSALTFEEAASAGDCDILIQAAPIDGPKKILAQSELPPAHPCRQQYDTAESWLANAAGQTQAIDLVAVMAHEIGHALGLLHDKGAGDALMDPFYNPAIRGPQAKDIARIKALYPGEPTPPPPPPSPTGGVKYIASMDADGNVLSKYEVLRRVA